MIRYLLLGGRWGPLPWQFLAALGVCCLGAAGLFYLMFGRWSNDRLLGGVDLAILLTTAAVLLAVGAHRRGRGRPAGPREPPAGQPRAPPPRALP
jgi:hypothetical protein